MIIVIEVIPQVNIAAPVFQYVAKAAKRKLHIFAQHFQIGKGFLFLLLRIDMIQKIQKYNSQNHAGNDQNQRIGIEKSGSNMTKMAAFLSEHGVFHSFPHYSIARQEPFGSRQAMNISPVPR